MFVVNIVSVGAKYQKTVQTYFELGILPHETAPRQFLPLNQGGPMQQFD